jgi:hypothetical protein
MNLTFKNEYDIEVLKQCLIFKDWLIARGLINENYSIVKLLNDYTTLETLFLVEDYLRRNNFDVKVCHNPRRYEFFLSVDNTSLSINGKDIKNGNLEMHRHDFIRFMGNTLSMLLQD